MATRRGRSLWENIGNSVLPGTPFGLDVSAGAPVPEGIPNFMQPTARPSGGMYGPGALANVGPGALRDVGPARVAGFGDAFSRAMSYEDGPGFLDNIPGLGTNRGGGGAGSMDPNKLHMLQKILLGAQIAGPIVGGVYDRVVESGERKKAEERRLEEEERRRKRGEIFGRAFSSAVGGG